ncbi:MAG: hypothetical protein N3C58_08110 [Meiothermus ruber]|jgi:hypothetical protein|nr:hypothetical protein [Meiothermus ruber]
MTKAEFRKALRNLLSQPVNGLDSWESRVSYLRQVIVELDKEQQYDQSNRGNAWTDDEPRLVLQLPPTKENIIRLARAFKRGYGSVEQIYRWAAEDEKSVRQKRPDDAFVQQIKRIVSEIGWRAT